MTCVLFTSKRISNTYAELDLHVYYIETGIFILFYRILIN